MESPTRRAMRDCKLAELGPRPSWYRVLARRRWDKRHAAIMAIDISTIAEILACHYNPATIVEMAQRQKVDFLCKPAPPNGQSWTTVIRSKVDE